MMKTSPDVLQSLLKKDCSFLVKKALHDDLGGGKGDLTAELVPSVLEKAAIITREKMVFCGKIWVEEVFKQLSDNQQIYLNWQVDDGQLCEAGKKLLEIEGDARILLTGERCALNFIQCLSATATQTRAYVDALKDFSTKLLDTRKTIPGLRLAQKYAVQCGGGVNHRLGLYDAYLIKENHIQACGSIAKAIHQAKQYRKHQLIEIEVENLEELAEALSEKPDIIMLDNFSPEAAEKAVNRVKGKVILEVSGNIHLDNIQQFAKTGVDYISCGLLTKSIQSIDISMLFKSSKKALSSL